MTNEELIAAIRGNEECNNCAIWKHGECNERKMSLAAADALETAEKRIADLETELAACRARREQIPKEGEWIEKWRFKTDGTPFHKIGDMECSVCHGDMLGRYYSKYCPHCGALLRGEHDEQIH